MKLSWGLTVDIRTNQIRCENTFSCPFFCLKHKNVVDTHMAINQQGAYSNRIKWSRYESYWVLTCLMKASYAKCTGVIRNGWLIYSTKPSLFSRRGWREYMASWSPNDPFAAITDNAALRDKIWLANMISYARHFLCFYNDRVPSSMSIILKAGLTFGDDIEIRL